jgi:hypothetical protein
MRFKAFITTLVLAGASLVAQETNQSVSNQLSGTNPTGASVNAVQSAVIRIVKPVAGQTLQADFVDVHFGVVQPNPSDQNNFYIQLDGNDPVSLTTTEYNFTGLHPGAHTVMVTEIDANGTPVPGSRATVQFKVAPPQTPQPAGGSTDNNTGTTSQPREMSSVLDASVGPNPARAMLNSAIPEELSGKHEGLPATGSSLPILSLVGFGVLVCGAIGAIRRARAR